MSTSEQRGEYGTDAPIAASGDDRFDRAPFAVRIARTIAAQKDPSSLVIGIYGEWGDGKTSLLNLIEDALGRHEDVVVADGGDARFHFQARGATNSPAGDNFSATIGDLLVIGPPCLNSYGRSFDHPERR